VTNGGISFPGQPDFYTAVNAPPGHYSMLCLLHPGMEIRIDVKRSDQSVPPPSKVAAKAAAQVQQATTQDGPVADAQAQQVSTSSIGNGHVQWAINAGGFSNNVTADEYLNSGVTIHVGDQLQVVGTGEIHTATTPFHSVAHVPFVVTQCEVPGQDIPAQSPADCPDPSEFRIAFNSKALFPSRTHALTNPTRFVSSGLLPGPGASATFDARTPGTYRFVCLVHGPSMSTTITVVS
ncbi:MAG TPA: hypothetical protein VEN82_02710, partial [Actinomycetota bacterium]|nr:hypothetical protein [Actinomycetota bacterium]